MDGVDIRDLSPTKSTIRSHDGEYVHRHNPLIIFIKVIQTTRLYDNVL